MVSRVVRRPRMDGKRSGARDRGGGELGKGQEGLTSISRKFSGGP